MMRKAKSTRGCSNKTESTTVNSCSRSKTATKSSNQVEASSKAGKTTRGRTATTRSKKSR